MAIDLDELERLHKAATPGPWEVKHLRTNHEFVFAQAPDCDMVFHAREADVRYITEACNAVPKLIDERHALHERIIELESELEVYRERELLEWERSRDDR